MPTSSTSGTRFADGMAASESRSQPSPRPTSPFRRWELANSSPGVVFKGVTGWTGLGAKAEGAEAVGTKQPGVEGAQATDGISTEEGGRARLSGSIVAAAVAAGGGKIRPGGVSGTASVVKVSGVGRNKSVAS